MTSMDLLAEAHSCCGLQLMGGPWVAAHMREVGEASQEQEAGVEGVQPWPLGVEGVVSQEVQSSD